MRGTVVIGNRDLDQFEQFVKAHGQRVFTFGVGQPAANIVRMGTGGAGQAMRERRRQGAEESFDEGALGR